MAPNMRLVVIIGILASTLGVARAQCGNPTAACDFYFSGLKNKVPTFKIFAAGAERVLSTPVYYKSGAILLSAATMGNQTCSIVGGGFCGDAFFFRPRGSFRKFVNRNNLLAARPVGKANLQKFKNKCVVVDLTSGKIKAGKGKNSAEWFNPNDGNKKFPADRRCVAFRTIV